MLLACLVLAACAGADEAVRADGSVNARVAPLGDVVTVEVGGRSFATRCAGDEDDRAVMLVSGLGMDMDVSWTSVQSRIGTFARVCAYDRLGVGASTAPPAAQTFQDMAQDLDRVMKGLGLQRPVVLVAHSLGGMVAMAFAQQNRDDVAAMLLLDATGPGYPQRVLDRLPRRSGASGGEERDDWEALLDPASNPERLDGRTSFAEADSYAPLGDLPLHVLTHSISEHRSTTSPRQQADLESAWEGGQHRWLALSTAAVLERVDLAGHAIQRDQPDVVVQRVGELVGD
jgi:pimeloyl-ACP methyl ester carboxylesterase